MLKQDVQDLLSRNPFVPVRLPFVPVRLHLADGRTFDVPFPDVARVLSYGVLVFIGMKEGTRQADSYDRFTFDQITRIETLTSRGGRGRKKAS
jgi:hypothetical protein